MPQNERGLVEPFEQFDGVVATTVVFSSAFPAMYSTWVKSRFQHIYDAVLATPVNVRDLVTAEVLSIAVRTGVFAVAPLSVAVAYGMKPGWGVVAVPFVAFLTGFGFAAFGVLWAWFRWRRSAREEEIGASKAPSA